MGSDCPEAVSAKLNIWRRVFSPLLYQLSYLAPVLLNRFRRHKDFGFGRACRRLTLTALRREC